MTKAFKLDWHLEVPSGLQGGATVDIWKEDGDLEENCLVRVDDCGFFIYWKSEGREGDVLELSQVNDIRTSKPIVSAISILHCTVSSLLSYHRGFCP